MRRLAILVLFLALMSAPVFARTQLQFSDPAEGALVSETAKITLRFSDALQPALSGARLVGPSGKTIPTATAVGMTVITLLVTFYLIYQIYVVQGMNPMDFFAYEGMVPGDGWAKFQAAFG